MRKPFSAQQRLDCQTVLEVQLNLHCRDEIIPVLRALQHIHGQPKLRKEILDLVAQDVNDASRHDRGREGLDYWQILVLAAVRLGCNLDYDKLQDLAEQHRALRQIMGVGDWEERGRSSSGGSKGSSCASPRIRRSTPRTSWCSYPTAPWSSTRSRAHGRLGARRPAGSAPRWRPPSIRS